MKYTCVIENRYFYEKSRESCVVQCSVRENYGCKKPTNTRGSSCKKFTDEEGLC